MAMVCENAQMPTSAVHRDRLQGLLEEIQCYKSCIHADAKAMQSVHDGPLPDLRGISYVKSDLCRSHWEA